MIRMQCSFDAIELAMGLITMRYHADDPNTVSGVTGSYTQITAPSFKVPRQHPHH